MSLTEREQLLAGSCHDHMKDLELLDILEHGLLDVGVSLASAEASRLSARSAFGIVDWKNVEVYNAVVWAWAERHKA